MLEITVNGKKKRVDVDPKMPLLWVLREEFQLTGTKFGCGTGVCGACTVHINGSPMRSCVMQVSAAANKEITTIEGMSGAVVEGLQKAWVEENVPQCGYCQSGQIMTAASLLESSPQPTDEEINNAMSGNLCRCGTYQRIKRAIHSAADALDGSVKQEVR
jgi:isoquinoline 1-oxidoreductase alpha subunit